MAIGSLFALEQPPFVAPDEIAHLGYAHEIADGRLPEIDRPPDIPAAAVQWQAEADSRVDDRYRGVWVANHPPLNYVLVAPLVWWAELTERPDGGLLYLRLANVVLAAVGVALTYLLGTELAGGVRRVGLAAAAVAALVPQGHAVFSQALNDGLGFAVGTAIVWAGVRCLRRGTDRRQLTLLAVAVAAGAGARSATMALGVVTVAWVAAAQLLGGPAGAGRRLGRAAVVGAAGLLPAAVLFGWFYVRNAVLYGDLGASDHLLRLFRRRRRGSVAAMLTRGEMWVGLYQRLLSPSTLRRRLPPGLTVATVVALGGFVAAVVTGRTGDRGDDGRPGVVSRPAVGLGGAAVAVIALTVVQHYSGGGNAYTRYVFPVLGVLASAVAIGLDRIWARVLPAVAVGLMAWWAIVNIPVAVDPTRVRRPRDDGAAPLILQVLPGSDGWRLAAAVLVVVGCAVAGAVFVAGVVGGEAAGEQGPRRFRVRGPGRPLPPHDKGP